MPSWVPHPATLEHAEGWIGVAGEPDRRIAYTDAVDAIYRHPFGAAAEGVEPGLEATRYWRIGNIYHQPEKQGRFSTYPTWPNGMAACVVEVDSETGLVRLLRWLLVEDAGVIVNPLLAEANLHGAIAQGIGSALYERIAYDAAGQLLTATLMDYTIPTAVEVPALRSATTPRPAPSRPWAPRAWASRASAAPSAPSPPRSRTPSPSSTCASSACPSPPSASGAPCARPHPGRRRAGRGSGAMTLEPTLLIQADRIVDGTGGPELVDAGVLVAGSRIAGSIPKGAPVPPSARVVEVAGGTDPARARRRARACRRAPGTGPRSSRGRGGADGLLHARVRPLRITTVRDTGGPDLDRTFRLFKSGRAGWPRFLGSGPNVDGLPGGPWPGLRTLDGVVHARQAVRELAAGGADFVKLYAWMGLDLVEAVVDEAHRLGLRVAGHVGHRVTVLDAAELGVDAFEHVRLGRELVPPERLPDLAALRPRRHDALASFAAWRFVDPDSRLVGEVIDRLVQRGVTLVPTLCISEVVLRHVPEDEALAGATWRPPSAVLETWRATRYDVDYDAEDRRWALVELERQLAFIGRAHAAGLRIVAGTDTPNPFIPPGRSLHRELELLVDSGLTAIEAVRSATLRAAELPGDRRRAGIESRRASGLTSSSWTGMRRGTSAPPARSASSCRADGSSMTHRTDPPARRPRPEAGALAPVLPTSGRTGRPPRATPRARRGRPTHHRPGASACAAAQADAISVLGATRPK